MRYVEKIDVVTDQRYWGQWNGKAIYLNPARYLDDDSGWGHWGAITGILGTLLHEMMHGFFAVFTREDAYGISPLNGGLGMDHHGPPWANAMEAVQTSLNQVLPFHIDGGIVHSVKESLTAYGLWASGSDMFRWGASESEIRDWSCPNAQPATSFSNPTSYYPTSYYPTSYYPPPNYPPPYHPTNSYPPTSFPTTYYLTISYPQ